MFLTNSKYFLPTKKYKLKKLFSISTDKTVNPSSILGISKFLMEGMLSKFLQNQKIFVSSVRFANVSFSNGSILKYAVDRIKNKKIFGIPKKIRRFFITHQEASSLCFKSVLKRNNGKILLPNYNTLKKDYLITDLITKILKYFNYKVVFCSNKKIKKAIKQNTYKVFLSTHKNDGQKIFEEFNSEEEKINIDYKDSTVVNVALPNLDKIEDTINSAINFQSTKKLKNFLKLKFKNYRPPRDYKKISKTL